VFELTIFVLISAADSDVADALSFGCHFCSILAG